MADQIKEGLNAHIKRIDDLIKNLNTEIAGLQRIEKALADANDRLRRQGGMIVSETHLIESLVKHEKPTSAAAILKPMLTAAAALDKVEANLEELITVGRDGNGNPVSIPFPATKR
jgi:hypothetical protein